MDLIWRGMQNEPGLRDPEMQPAGIRSLSVGDVIVFDGGQPGDVAFAVSGVGFKQIDVDEVRKAIAKCERYELLETPAHDIRLH